MQLLGCKHIEKGQTGKVPGVMSNDKQQYVIVELRKAPGCSTELYFTVRPRTGLDSGCPHGPWNILEMTNAPLQWTSFSKDESPGVQLFRIKNRVFWLRSSEFYRLFVLIELLTVPPSSTKASAAVCAARSAVGGKSLQSFTGVSPSRTESALASVARISP